MHATMNLSEAKFTLKDIFQYFALVFIFGVSYANIKSSQETSENNFKVLSTQIQDLKQQNKDGNSKNDIINQNVANQVNLNTQQIELLKQQIEFIKQDFARKK